MLDLTDRHIEARTMTDLAGVYVRHESLSAAIMCYERRLAAVRELGDLDAEMQTLRELDAMRARMAAHAAPARSNARTAS
jgi:hypothetical protein